MADFHDEVLVTWRADYLEEIEDYCYENPLNTAPKKFKLVIWLAVLGALTAASITVSWHMRESFLWASNMLGNIAAGLIASITILIFSTHKEKNLAYYDRMLLDLSQIEDSIRKACNNIYFEERELSRNPYLYNMDDYDFFAAKVLLLHKTLTDIYRQIINNDKLEYKSFSLTSEQLDLHDQKVEKFSLDVSLANTYHKTDNYKCFEEQYRLLYDVEFKITQDIRRYIVYARDSLSIMRYGKSISRK